MKVVEISDNEWNYLKDDGSYLLEEHVNYCWYFIDGFGKVQYNNFTYNFVNSECELLLKTNVYYCNNFYKGFAIVKSNDIWYYIDKECNFYNFPNRISFKELYNEYPNMRSELIEIIDKYTYFNIEEYFI